MQLLAFQLMHVYPMCSFGESLLAMYSIPIFISRVMSFHHNGYKVVNSRHLGEDGMNDVTCESLNSYFITA